jgi:hypothetical protein
VILHALAALALSRAGLIGAGAGLHVFSDVTFHIFTFTNPKHEILNSKQFKNSILFH